MVDIKLWDSCPQDAFQSAALVKGRVRSFGADVDKSRRLKPSRVERPYGLVVDARRNVETSFAQWDSFVNSRFPRVATRVR